MNNCIQIEYSVFSEDGMRKEIKTLRIPLPERLLNQIFPKDKSQGNKFSQDVLLDVLMEIAYDNEDPNHDAVNELLSSNRKFETKQEDLTSLIDVSSGYPKYNELERINFLTGQTGAFPVVDNSGGSPIPVNYNIYGVQNLKNQIDNMSLTGFKAKARAQINVIKTALASLEKLNSGVGILASHVNFNKNLKATTDKDAIKGVYDARTKLIMIAPPQAYAITSTHAKDFDFIKMLNVDEFRNDFLHEVVHAVHDASLAQLSKSKKIDLNNALNDFIAKATPSAKNNKELKNTLNVLEANLKNSKYKGLQELLAYYYTSPALRSALDKHSPKLVESVYEFLGDFTSDPQALYEVLNSLTTISVAVPTNDESDVEPEQFRIEQTIQEDTVDVDYEDVTDETTQESEEDSDEDVEDDPNGRSYQVIDNSKMFLEHEIKKVTEANKKTVNKYVWDTFMDSKYSEGKNDSANNALRFKISYGSDIQLTYRNLSVATNLKQHDLIRFAVSTYEPSPDNPKFQVKAYTGITAWAPIIKTFYYKNEFFYEIATKDGSKNVRISDVSHFKQSKGVIDKSIMKSVDQNDLKDIWADFAWRSYGTKVTMGDSTILSEEDFENIPSNYKLIEVTPEKGDPFEKRIFASGNTVYISMNEATKARQTKNRKLKEEGEEAQFENLNDDVFDDDEHFNSLQPGDVIDYKIWDKTQKKEITVRAPVYRVYGDVVELIKSPAKNLTDLNKVTLETYLIPRSRIAGIIMNLDRHLDNPNSAYSVTDDLMNYQTGDPDPLSVMPTDKLDWLLRRGFFNTRGLKKITLRNVNSDFSVAPDEKQTWYSLHRSRDIKFREEYNKWRSEITEDDYAALSKESIKDPKTLEFYYHSLAIERRKSLASNLGIGSYVQLESLYKVQDGNGNWIVDESRMHKPKLTKAKVIAKNGNYLKVVIFEPTFDSTTKGAKVTGYTTRFQTINILNNDPGESGLRQYAIRSVYHDNSEYVPFVDFLSELKQVFKNNYEKKNAIFAKDNTDFSAEDLQSFNYASTLNRLNSLNSEERAVDLETATSYKDVYDIYELNENAGHYEKLKALNRTDAGSIVLLKIKNKEGGDDTNRLPYKAAIVVGKDPKSGLPKIAYEYTGYETDSDNNRTDKVIKREFTVRTVTPSEIFGVGYLKTSFSATPLSDTPIDIMPDSYSIEQVKRQAKEFIEFRKLKKFDTEYKANEYLKGKNFKNLNNIEVIPLYVYPDTPGGTPNKRDVAHTGILYSPVRKYVTKEGRQGFFPINDTRHWKYVKASEMAQHSTAALLSNIEEGDIIQYDGAYKNESGQLMTKGAYITVTSITGNTIYGRVYYNPKDNPDTVKHFSVALNVKSATGMGLTGVRQIYLDGGSNDFIIDRQKRLQNGTANEKKYRIIGNSLVKNGLSEKFDNSIAVSIAHKNYDGPLAQRANGGTNPAKGYNSGAFSPDAIALNVFNAYIGPDADVTKLPRKQLIGLAQVLQGMSNLSGEAIGAHAANQKLTAIANNPDIQTAEDAAAIEDDENLFNKSKKLITDPFSYEPEPGSQYDTEGDEDYTSPAIVDESTAKAVSKNNTRSAAVIGKALSAKAPSVNLYMDSLMSKANVDDFYNSDPANKNKIMKVGNVLSDLYNIPVHYVTSEEIKNMFDGILPTSNFHEQRAMIWNNEIYINLDKSTLGEPVHEIAHFVISGLAISDPKLYRELLNLVMTHPKYDKVVKAYPELKGDLLLEEVLTNIIGERYANQAQNLQENSDTTVWEKANPGFWSKLLNSFKTFFAKLFGIDSHRYFNTDADVLMMMTPSDIIDTFTNNLLEGKLKTAAEYGKQRLITIENGTYLKPADSNDTSSFYKKLTQDGFNKKFAEESWFNLKNGNFAEWHNNSLVVAQDGEPVILYRTDNPVILTDVDTSGLKDVVVLKGEFDEQDGVYIIENPTNAKSLYSLAFETDANYDNDFQSYANRNDIPLLGSATDIRKSLNLLRDQFKNKSFTMYNVVGDLYMVKTYDTPNDDVLQLREKLFSKNLIKALC